MAWDRLRHVLTIEADGPSRVAPGSEASLTITVANTGSGHNFPTGFPEGRIAWLAVHAVDLASGRELPLRDTRWNRVSAGVGDLTREEVEDPEFPGCHWKLPSGSVDPFAVQFKAVASLGDGCPTLDLPYATPLNLITDKRTGLPVDQKGQIIDAVSNPRGLPQFTDSNHNGDLFDDSFLRDTRLAPLPQVRARAKIDRYAVVVPPGTVGPIAVSAAVYYQSVEAIVAGKFLGNLADTNTNHKLEPCVLGGLCDGRHPTTEPAVVEGAPPVPMTVHSWTIQVAGAAPDRTPPVVTAMYPLPYADRAYEDAVVKVSFGEPVRGVNAGNFTLVDAAGAPVAAWVDQIGAGTFALFPSAIHLKKGGRYTARLAAGVCDLSENCTTQDLSWSFTVAVDPEQATGDTSVPLSFGALAGAL
jgi:hypothetical protein